MYDGDEHKKRSGGFGGEGFFKFAKQDSDDMAVDDQADEVKEYPFSIVRMEEFQKLLKEVFYSNNKWRGAGRKGASVEIPLNEFKAKADKREKIQGSGMANRCHTCLTDISSDENQPFIGDHIPPKKIYRKFIMKDLADIFPRNWDGGFRLLAHCDACAARQSALVRELLNWDSIKSAYDELSPEDKKLITGGRRGRIPGRDAKVSEAEGLLVQEEGEKLGCHSCARGQGDFPNKIYHADHFPPAELLTSYFPKLLRHLHLDDMPIDNKGGTIGKYLERPVLRPQCARCSHEQGGKANTLTKLATEMAKELGIPVYK